MGEEHQAWASAKAEQKKLLIPSHPLCAGFFAMVYIYFCLLSVPSLMHKQLVILNQPGSRTTGPEESDSVHLQEPNLQHPWATGPAESEPCAVPRHCSAAAMLRPAQLHHCHQKHEHLSFNMQKAPKKNIYNQNLSQALTLLRLSGEGVSPCRPHSYLEERGLGYW